MTAESGAVHLSCWYSNNNSNNNNNNNNKYNNDNENHRWNKLLVHRKVFILAVLMAVCALGQAAVNLTYRKVKKRWFFHPRRAHGRLRSQTGCCESDVPIGAEDSKIVVLAVASTHTHTHTYTHTHIHSHPYTYMRILCRIEADDGTEKKKKLTVCSEFDE